MEIPLLNSVSLTTKHIAEIVCVCVCLSVCVCVYVYALLVCCYCFKHFIYK